VQLLGLDLAGSIRPCLCPSVGLRPKAEPNYTLFPLLLITEFGQEQPSALAGFGPVSGIGLQVQIGMKRIGDQQATPYYHANDAPAENADQGQFCKSE
jgi:hypothetical protein